MRRFNVPSEYWASDEPVVVDELKIRGNEHTRLDVFHLLLGDAKRATSANELHSTLSRGRAKLLGLGIFRNVSFLVDTGAGPGHASVGVLADELPRKEYGGGLAGGGGDRVLLSGSLAVLNAFGRGEAFRSTASYSAPGSAGHFAMDISLRKPLLWASTTVPVAWSALLHLHEIDRSAESSHIERLGSLTAAFHYGTVSWRLTSTLSRLMPYQWRDRESSQPECSQANLLQFGWRPKTSLGMEWIVDTRDNPLCAMEGSLRRGSVEFAGSPQMQRLLYLKAEAGVQHSQLVWFGGSVTLRARAGHIVPLGDDGPRGSTPRLTSVDAFFLGGAAELPGFQARGAGRTSSLESLGAASYWLTSAHWTLPVPGAPEMLRVQFHASAAGLAGLLGGPPEQRDLSHAFSPDALRASAGVGLVAAIPGTGRVSVSISKILAARLEDNTTQLFQLGFATSFD